MFEVQQLPTSVMRLTLLHVAQQPDLRPSAYLITLPSLDSAHGMQESEQLTTSVMRLMLFRQGKQPDVPVRRADIASVVKSRYAQHGLRNLTGDIIALAQVPILYVPCKMDTNKKSFPESHPESAAAQEHNGCT